MQYFMNASDLAPSVTNFLIVPLRESRRLDPLDETYGISLTCDITKENKQFEATLEPFQDTPRYSRLRFRLVNDIANEDLLNGDVFFEPTGSYTWFVFATADAFIHQRGKAIVYPYGTFSTETKFGNEVTYDEYTNPTTNTVYIQA